MKKIYTILALCICLLGMAYGQTDANFKPALKKMLEVAGTEASFKMAIKQVFEMFKQRKTSVPDSIWVYFEKEFSNTSLDELVNMLTPVYEKYLTTSDLEYLIAFYETPVGKKYAEKTPFIMSESMKVGQEWGKKIGDTFIQKLKDKGY